MSKETGGSAFPWNGQLNRDLEELSGMTLRDYFAAKAMQALVPGISGDNWENITASQAYIMADAMLEARKK